MVYLLLLLSQKLQVTVSPVSKPAAERILSKRIAKVSMPWTVSMENQSIDPLTVSESAILRRIPQLQPFDHVSMSLLISEGQRNGIWARAGRAGEDVTKLAAFLAAAKQIRWGASTLTILTAVTALSPYVIQRVRGAERPVQDSFERLAWIQPVSLQPGESATARVFTAVWPNPQPVSFTIDTTKTMLRKGLQ